MNVKTAFLCVIMLRGSNANAEYVIHVYFMAVGDP